MVLKRFGTIVAALFLAVLAGCSSVPEQASDGSEVTRLAQEIMALGPDVDPEEAARAAQIAYDYTAQLVVEYEIVDPPLVHNTKVNMGLKPRGLCWHWAEDMERRLDAEAFETLEMHRAIANADVAFRIDHSTAIVSAKGDDMYAGIVLDPWRYGGTLFWDQTVEDERYEWFPQQQVLAEKRAKRLAAERRAKRLR